MDTRNFKIDKGSSLRCLLSPPRSSGAEDTPSPVLRFLHGYEEGAPLQIETALTRHGPLRRGNPPIVDRFVVVAPQLPVRGGVWRRYADDVEDVVRRVRKKHKGDIDRTYPTGFSFGGWVDLALRQPDFWAALWAVNPTRVSEPDREIPVWLSFGEVARRAKETFINALDLKPKGEDPEGDRVYLDEGEDHVGSATRAYHDERICSWLLARRLKRR